MVKHACICPYTEQCLQQGEGRQLPDFKDMAGNGAPIYRRHQAIIPTYKFECCGNITEWGVDVHTSNDQIYMPYIFKCGDHHPLWMTLLEVASTAW